MNERKKPVVLSIQKGAKVTQGDREYVVTRVVDLDKVLAKELASGELVVLSLNALDAPQKLKTANEGREKQLELESVTSDEWKVAEDRLRAIEPLLERRSARTKQDYLDAAKRAGVSQPTIYRWLQNYQSTELLSSLLNTKRDGGSEKSRLREDVKLILDDFLNTKFLSLQKFSPAAAAREIRRLCSNAGIDPLPSHTTVYRHIEWMSEEVKLRKREGPKAAREAFGVSEGSIPDADWPLAMVQIDHTLLPVMLVDDEHRKPITRPWITLAIDCYSRVCVGFYLTLDPPSAMSTGMCVSHALLTKDTWLARLGLTDVTWPFYGTMDVLHMDNAKEFRGDMLRVAAKEYNISLNFRRVKVPHYGGHIERLMGTVSQGLKEISGTTFSNPKEKGVYDAEGNACMTFDEIERWLVLFFVRYHIDIHRGIGTTPKAKWTEGLVGTKKLPGRGLPLVRKDVEKVRIDFMPFDERTIQDYGIVIDEIHYFHDVLRPWVNAMDPDHPREKRKFRFRYDPQDISQRYFFDPLAQRYFAIPYRDSSLPPVSIWEHRAARVRAKELGIPGYSERDIFDLITKQREIEEEAASKTKSARRAQQKLKNHAKSRVQTKQDLPKVSNQSPSTVSPAIKGYNPDDIEALDDDY